MNHVSVSPADRNGPTQVQRITLTREGTHDLRIRSPLLYRLRYKVRQGAGVGTEDVKVTAMNMYMYKEGLPCSSVGRAAVI